MKRGLFAALVLVLLGVPLLGAKSSKERPPAETIRIHVLNMGQGDGTIIEGPRDERGDRKIMIYDAGESSMRGNEAQHVVEPYLRRHTDDGKPGRAILDIDYMIPSHYHKDHMGSTRGKEPTGLFYLYEALNIRVGKVLDGGIDFDAAGQGDMTYRAWVKDRKVDREKLAFDQLGPNRQIDMGKDLWVEVLAVGAEVEGRGRVVADRYINTTSQNDFCLTLVLHYKKFDFYIAGDLSGYLHESWGAWYHDIEAATYPHLRRTEVYRVNHHGSQWSSNYPFLQRLRPIVSVISAGKGHHHPNRHTIERLLGFEDYWTGRPLGSDIYQTKNEDGFVLWEEHPHTLKTQTLANGHIVIESDGLTGFTVTMPGREPIPYPLHPDGAFLDVPWSVKKARKGEREEYERVFDRDDVESGATIGPRGDDGEGGGD
jgi:beta-lactamase superfamily II metal-dependent hydrolase